jgi:anaerobic selenocysteine-containing dehydrogenase
MRNIPSPSRHLPHTVAEVHPDTAAGRQVRDGDMIFVESPRGRIECQAKLTDEIHQGIVHVFFGLEDANANLLTDGATFDPITGSVPMRSSLCRIGKVVTNSNVLTGAAA